MIDTPRTHDVAALLNAQRFGRFHVMLIGLSLLVTFFDGFDMMMLSFAAPHIRETFGFGPIDLGHIFSSGLAGMVLGGFTLPWLGDRIGRRPTIILGVVGFGLFTLGTVMVASKAGFMTMRFLNGLALGGVLPLVWTLNIELVPQRLRASVVTIIMVGYSCGCALAGPLTVALVGRWGWQGVFGAGGIASLVCAVALAIWLPESLRFLILHQRPGARITAVLRLIAPDAHARPQDRFQLADEARAQEGAAPFRLADLFAGPLARITPFLWLGYIASTFGVYFGTSWGPILIEGMHFSRTSAAYLASMNSVAGALSGLALMRVTDRHGPWGLAVLAGMAVPLSLAIGLSHVEGAGYVLLALCSGTLLGGAHFGIISLAGLYYPSAIRANGAGWAAGIAKIGGVFAPMVGAWLLAQGLPIRSAYVFMGICPLVLCISALGIARALRREDAPVARNRPVAAVRGHA